MPVNACPGRDPGTVSRFIVFVTSKKLDSGMRRNDNFLPQTNFSLGQRYYVTPTGRWLYSLQCGGYVR